jgi:peptide/nickel transport system substrate-binding protein
MLFASAACSDSSEGAKDAAQGETSGGASSVLVYGSGDYSSINPALYEHGEINLLLFAGLMRHDADDRLVPALAEDFSYDGDRLVYTFRLREGLTFHDGEPLTAEDVKFTLETIMNPDNGSEIASNYEEIESVTAVDARTVEIKLSVPNAAMPDYLVIGILPKHILDGQDVTTAEFNQKPVGAGPYRLTGWDMGQSITLERFDGFYLGAPNIERIIFKIVEDYDARALQLKAGELDLAQITPKDAEEFKNSADFDVYDMDTADYRGIMYNFGNAFWKDNPGLPAALSFAVDREAVVRGVLLGRGQAAYSPLQKGPYGNPDIERYAYDPDRAKAEIEALGWKIGPGGYYEKDGKELSFSISVRPSDQVRVDMANVCAQNFRDIGVNANVEINENTDWAGQYCFLIGWGSPFDPDDHTYKIFGTDKGANYSAYSNAEVDRVLTEARSTGDSETRTRLYLEFQEILSKNPAYTFIAYIDAIYVAKKGLSGITADTTLGHHGVGIFWNVYEWTK